jgi:uncharacterized OB-fold protein
LKEIKAFRCASCGRTHYPYHDRCLNCRGRDFETIEAEGNARLLTFTQLFALPWGFDQQFLFLGVVEFENGVRALGQIKAESLDELSIGMWMKPSWEPVRVQYGPVRRQYGEDVYGLKLGPLT